jgi:flotillin
MFGIKVPEANEAMIISGGKGGSDGTPFKVVIGTKAFVPPVIRNVSFLTLSMQESEVSERCITQKGITLQVQAVIAFKIANDTPSIVNAAQRFLTDQAQMTVLTGRIFSGHLRSIVGSMTVEEIITERQRLATEVLDASKGEMAKLGLLVDSLQISNIDDLGTGYIESISAPQRAAVAQAAKIAQAEADRAAAEAEQKSVQAQAEYARQTAEVQAQQASLQAQAKAKADGEAAVAAANAEASAVEAQQQSETRQAAAKQATLDAQALMAEREAELRQQQLVGEVIKPAEADAQKVKIAAKAQAEATQLQAEAAASHDRVALDRMLIEQMPQIVREAAAGLAGSNLTVLNGSEGLSSLAAGLVGQGIQIFSTVRGGILGHGNSEISQASEAAARKSQAPATDAATQSA